MEVGGLDKKKSLIQPSFRVEHPRSGETQSHQVLPGVCVGRCVTAQHHPPCKKSSKSGKSDNSEGSRVWDFAGAMVEKTLNLATMVKDMTDEVCLESGSTTDIFCNKASFRIRGSVRRDNITNLAS